MSVEARQELTLFLRREREERNPYGLNPLGETNGHIAGQDDWAVEDTARLLASDKSRLYFREKNSEIRKITRAHQHYLLHDADGWESMRADFSYRSYVGCSFAAKHLNFAYFHGTDLRNAVFAGTQLFRTRFSDADGRRADFRGAYLLGADFTGADLRGADFRRADLTFATFIGAYLDGADFTGARLTDACFDLTVFGAARMPDLPMICPERGAFQGFKTAGGTIVHLLIPEDAKRLSGTGTSCRCDRAEVLAITKPGTGEKAGDVIRSDADPEFVYRIGKTVSVPDFDECRWHQETTGIHFYMTEREAYLYSL